MVEAQALMMMRDPEVRNQADLAPYPDGPGKIVHKWEVSMRFVPTIGSPIQFKVKGVPGGAAGVVAGSAFDGIAADDLYQDVGLNYQGVDAQGCLVLQRASVGESSSPLYDKNANHFPDPNVNYPRRRMNTNGRWFLVRWRILLSKSIPSLALVAEQGPWVSTVSARKCPDETTTDIEPRSQS